MPFRLGKVMFFSKTGTLRDRVNAIRAKRSQHLPVALSPKEVLAITQQTAGVYRMML